MSMLGFVNFVCLQWFTLRIAKVSFQGRTLAILYRGIVPLTGWWSDFRMFKWSDYGKLSSEQLKWLKNGDYKG